MQKIKYLPFSLLLLFITSCENDYNDEFNTIEVRLTTEDNISPEGNAYVFYLGKNENLPEILDVKFDNESEGRYCPFFVLYNWQGKSSVKFYPVSEYGDENAGVLHRYTKYSYATFYVERLSQRYGVPQPGDVFIILISPYRVWEASSFIVVSIEKNCVIKAIYTNVMTTDARRVDWGIKGGKDIYPYQEIIKVIH